MCHESNRLKKAQPGAIHWASEHVIIVSKRGVPSFATPSRHFDVSIYKEDGYLEQHFVIKSGEKYAQISGITMEKHGRIAWALSGKNTARY